MIFLSKPVPMKKVIVACPVNYKEKTIEILHEAGVIDIVQREDFKLASEYEVLMKIRDEISGLISKLKNIDVKIELTELEARALEIDKIKADVDSLYYRVSSVESEIATLKKRDDELIVFSKLLSKLPDSINPLDIYYEGKRISSTIVVGDVNSINKIRELRQVLAYSIYRIDEEHIAILVYLDSEYFNGFLEQARSLNTWIPSKHLIRFITSAGDMKELRELINKVIENTRSKITSLENQVQSLIKDHIIMLGKYLLHIDNLLQRYRVLVSLRDLKHITVLTGWIPENSLNYLEKAIRNIDMPIYYSVQDPDPDDNPPTLMKNKPVIRFYQLITRLYGIPGYREWDPTPVIAYSFALFFGLMNADFGYAIAGLLATVLLLDKFVIDTSSNTYREFKGTLIVSNIIAAILGFLTGSIFGNLLEGVIGLKIPAYITWLITPLDFIKLSLVIGLIHINIAHILATARFIKERRAGELIIEIGLFIAQIFGIPYILASIMRYKVPVLGDIPLEILLTGSLVGIALIIIGSYLVMKVLGFLMWIFQVTGVLGDVLSYVRLAGVGLATYYMASIFNLIISMVASYFSQFHVLIGALVAAPLVFIVHFIVFVFAQLGAFIHSLRLCMLEFLMKFYDGNGREYSPFRVVNKLVLTTKV